MLLVRYFFVSSWMFGTAYAKSVPNAFGTLFFVSSWMFGTAYAKSVPNYVGEC